MKISDNEMLIVANLDNRNNQIKTYFNVYTDKRQKYLNISALKKIDNVSHAVTVRSEIGNNKVQKICIFDQMGLWQQGDLKKYIDSIISSIPKCNLAANIDVLMVPNIITQRRYHWTCIASAMTTLKVISEQSNAVGNDLLQYFTEKEKDQSNKSLTYISVLPEKHSDFILLCHSLDSAPNSNSPATLLGCMNNQRQSVWLAGQVNTGGVPQFPAREKSDHTCKLM
jgi:hypothetical protein